MDKFLQQKTHRNGGFSYYYLRRLEVFFTDFLLTFLDAFRVAFLGDAFFTEVFTFLDLMADHSE